MQDIPDNISKALTKAAKQYSDSPATSNAGRWLRFIASIVPVEVLVKLIAHKLSK